MLIRELVYDTEADELDLLIDTLQPEPAEVIPIGDDVFLRRSIESGKIVGATIANYSLWYAGRLPTTELDPKWTEAHAHILRYLQTVKHKIPVQA